MPPLDPAHTELLDDYVGDVLRHLPARRRTDIGPELRTLLEDALAARAAESGRAVDDALVLALLREHGAPHDVAARYLEPGLVLIRAADTGRFLRFAIGGVLLQWALTLPAALGDPYALGRWWLSRGVGALWWPGALVLGMAARGWWRARATAAPVPTRHVDRERIDRRSATIGISAIGVGATIVCALPWLATWLPAPLASIFAVDGDFLRTRAWPAVPLYAATVAVRVAALRSGRRTRRLRLVHGAIDVAWLATLIWWAVGAPVFATARVDAAARGVIVLCAGVAVATLATALASRRPSFAAPPPSR